MKSAAWIMSIAVAAFVVAVLAARRGDEEIPGRSVLPSPRVAFSPPLVSPAPTMSPASVAEPASVTVTYGDDGFSPASVRVKKGDSVTFSSGSQEAMRPASATHPTHEAYPGSSIRKCGGPDETAGRLFDACRAVDPGASWTFQFNEVGTWHYHDHLNASRRGTVAVEE